MQKKKLTEDGKIIVAENVKMIIEGATIKIKE
jgi:hypothetical protein